MCIHVCVCVERGGGGGEGVCLCVCKRVCDIIGNVWVGGVCVSEHVCCVCLYNLTTGRTKSVMFTLLAA